MNHACQAIWKPICIRNKKIFLIAVHMSCVELQAINVGAELYQGLRNKG